MAVLFNVHPWQMLRLEPLRRQWFEQAALRHREREHDRLQQLVDVVSELLSRR